MISANVSIAIIASVGISASAVAQPLTPDVERQTARSQGMQAGADVASWLAGKLNDLAIDAEIRRGFEVKASEIEKIRPWLSDRGLLIDVRIAIARAGALAGQHTKLTMIDLRGVGSTPKEVLEKPRAAILPGPSEGYEHSLERSYYVWISEGKSEAIRYPFNNVLLGDAIAARSAADLRELRESQRELGQLEALDRAAAHAIEELPARAQAKTLLGSAAEAQRKLVTINERLRHELERARRADEALVLLRTLGDVLDFTMAANQALEKLGSDAPSSLQDVSTSAKAIEYVERIRYEASNNVWKIRRERNLTTTDRDGSVNNLRRFLEERNVPASILLP